MADEIWKPVMGYEGLYEVSSLGRVRNAGGLILKDRTLPGGYNRARLSKDSIARDHLVHRLVARAFLGPFPSGKEVNHKNAIRADNRVENLEYMTRAENVAHQRKFGTFPEMEANGRARLTRQQVLDIRERAGREFHKDLAAAFGVSKSLISAIVRRECWAQV